ncbi:geranylgeranyl reductase family protein [Propionimicrobium lymphophilum]|uniref:geranylgeranyl reductase family protein n=1 Tax=Propionimicrobium lymphophilum TaxID=33012 RepID=UPI0004034D50|nr:geranylgeranyl reductase family protein [Propionimicrobium lymphophilum]
MSEHISGPRASKLGAEQVSADMSAQVIVVGAGPAGSATAAFLARYGIDVLLVEKSKFPRDKICGDGLTPRAVRMLNRLGVDTSEEAGWTHNVGLRVYGGRPEPFDMPWPELSSFPNYGMVCRREVFDDMLAGLAVSYGARLMTESRVDGPIYDKDGRVVGVKANGHELRAPIVVGADGISAKLATRMGIKRNPKRPMGVAVRAYYKSPLAESDWMISHLELWDGKPGHSSLLPGYGWIFPAGDGVCNVGLGMLNSSPAFGNTNYKELMGKWLASTDPEWGFSEDNQLCEIKGAGLPMAFNRKPHYRDGVLLVGDAGGMVSPFNGEGIDYAMEAAEIAAGCIVEAFGRGVGTDNAELALRRYPQLMADHVGGHFRLGTIFARLIGEPKIMHLCVKYGLPRPALMKLVHKMLANLTVDRGGNWADKLLTFLDKAVPSA